MIGPDGEVEWLCPAADGLAEGGGDLQIMYGVDGERVLTESVLNDRPLTGARRRVDDRLWTIPDPGQMRARTIARARPGHLGGAERTAT